EALAVESDVERAAVGGGGVVVGDRQAGRDVPGLPQVRVVDDRELEAFAAVHGEQLDRLGVGLQAAAAGRVVAWDSRRRLLCSSLGSGSASATRRRSHATSAVVPSCSVVAAACSSW